MLADQMNNPEDYLEYSEQLLIDIGIFKIYPKLSAFYYDLCKEFKLVYYKSDISTFGKWGCLLEIDAQVQILIDLAETLKANFKDEFGLAEEEIIKMIKSDKNSFYRELTGYKNKDNPPWSLIYLSEDLISD